MNYNEAKEKLEKYSQSHVLQYYDDLCDACRNEFLKQIDSTDFGVIDTSIKAMNDKKQSVITPIKALQLDEINNKKDTYYETGLKAIKNGETAAVLLAGGMGTRLGADGPKGIYDIGETKPKYIFECIINNLMDVTNAAGNFIHLFVMTSDKNHEVTVSFLKEHNYFGYDENYIHFFKQEMAVATDTEGKILLDKKCHMANSPNGNGGWFISLIKSGLINVIKDNNIKWLNVFAVDNVLQRICDPLFIGATIEEGKSCGAKVVKKASPDEKVGVMCLKDGNPSVVEYYELTEELMNTKDENGDPAYNFGVILNYLFDVATLEKISNAALPWHVVSKKVPHLDNNGKLVKPEEPNAYKYETLILDMVEMFDSCLPFEVIREKEFAPIKNKTGVDSVDSARELLKKNGVTL
ncbi:MAG: UDPGP type 1 family protein [Lachnospiraceae bacterium]|nr:UDPGP type 1 family protein [Lachnospiraceae bacterium]